MDTFAEWEATVLDLSYENVDLVSLHTYYNNHEENTPNFLARSMDLGRFISSVASICDYIQAKKKSKKRLYLSLNEWNVWKTQGSSRTEEPWEVRLPEFEDVYNMEDALVVGCCLLIWRRSLCTTKKLRGHGTSCQPQSGGE